MIEDYLPFVWMPSCGCCWFMCLPPRMVCGLGLLPDIWFSPADLVFTSHMDFKSLTLPVLFVIPLPLPPATTTLPPLPLSETPPSLPVVLVLFLRFSLL